MGRLLRIGVLFAFILSACTFAGEFTVFGKLKDRKSPFFNPGEKMVFELKVLEDGKPVSGYPVKWERTGDDGKKEKGEFVSAEEGNIIEALTDQPGFVRIYAVVYDKDGKTALTFKDNKGRTQKVFFDGGAGVEPEKLQSIAEPADFDAFWEKQKKKLAAVEMKVLEKKQVAADEKGVVYDVKVSCAGSMPVSGYLMMPLKAKEKSLKAMVTFRGYGVTGSNYNIKSGYGRIVFAINAHGFLNGQPKEYYENLKKTTLKSYGFDVKENSDPETTYFNGMYLRVMRALEFVKSLPEWNGKDLEANGGSQGGMQSLAAAGLDKDVNTCYAWSPWCCDLGRTELKRLVGGWYIKYTPALLYYDPVNLVKRANPECSLSIVSNLGDYVCPPSGVWIAYNNFPGPKKMEVRQGCEHGYRMPNYPKYFFSGNQKK